MIRPVSLFRTHITALAATSPEGGLPNGLGTMPKPPGADQHVVCVPGLLTPPTADEFTGWITDGLQRLDYRTVPARSQQLPPRVQALCLARWADRPRGQLLTASRYSAKCQKT
jgi:hypothetical protein